MQDLFGAAPVGDEWNHHGGLHGAHNRPMEAPCRSCHRLLTNDRFSLKQWQKWRKSGNEPICEACFWAMEQGPDGGWMALFEYARETVGPWLGQLLRVLLFCDLLIVGSELLMCSAEHAAGAMAPSHLAEFGVYSVCKRTLAAEVGPIRGTAYTWLAFVCGATLAYLTLVLGYPIDSGCGPVRSLVEWTCLQIESWTSSRAERLRRQDETRLVEARKREAADREREQQREDDAAKRERLHYEESQRVHKQGGSMIAAGKIDRAIDVFEKALKKNPSDKSLVAAVDKAHKKQEQRKRKEQKRLEKEKDRAVAKEQAKVRQIEQEKVEQVRLEKLEKQRQKEKAVRDAEDAQKRLERAETERRQREEDQGRRREEQAAAARRARVAEEKRREDAEEARLLNEATFMLPQGLFEDDDARPPAMPTSFASGDGAARPAGGASGAAAAEHERLQDCICPMTLEIMVDPVTDALGHTYERSAIEEWFARNTALTSPKTNQTLPNKLLVPNTALRKTCNEVRARMAKEQSAKSGSAELGRGGGRLRVGSARTTRKPSPGLVALLQGLGMGEKSQAYATSLAQHGFEDSETLRLASKADLMQVGLKLGHALKVLQYCKSAQGTASTRTGRTLHHPAAGPL